MRETPTGWLAVSTDEYPRIGVVADTADHAREQFELSRSSWLKLLEVADPTDV